MAPTAADVPDKYDLVLGSYGGFVFDRASSEFYRQAQAEYGYTPTFLERQNVSGKYGDDEQDFFLTASQNDWSLGGGQRFLRVDDAASSRQYYAGAGVDTSLPGQITMRRDITATSLAGNVKAACAVASGAPTADQHAFVVSTNLYTVSAAGAVTDQGAHGAGTVTGICTDGVNLYISGGTKLRKWNGSGYSDFSATVTGDVAFLNNILFGYSGGTLVEYDTSGTQGTLFTWQDATGSARAATGRLMPFGAQLLIYFPLLTDRPELWVYDGTGVSRILELPVGAVGHDIEVLEGVVFVSGAVYDTAGGNSPGLVPVVWAYVNGTLAEIWRAETNFIGVVPTVNSLYMPALGTFAGRLMFTDQINQNLMEYDLTTGAITTVAHHAREGSPSSTTRSWMTSAPSSVFLCYDAGAGAPKSVFYPDTSNFVSTASVESSLFDFDNSLQKVMRGVKVEWAGGGSVDIAYQLDGLSGSYTTLQAAAVSGTEYLFPAGTTCHNVAVKLTLNNSAGRPTLKRLYVRAAPVLQSYRQANYVLDLSGNKRDPDAENRVVLRDGGQHPFDGQEQRDALINAVKAAAPFTITDRVGSFTGIVEPGSVQIDEIRAVYGRGEYRAKITVREV